jgi:hypothetical protein
VKTTGKQLSPEEFRTQCFALPAGHFSPNGNACVSGFYKDLPPGSRGYVEIDPDYYTGKYIIATGNFGNRAVTVVIDGKPILTNPGEFTYEGHGSLGFMVTGSDFKDVSVSLYSCFDRSMDKIVCRKEDI